MAHGQLIDQRKQNKRNHVLTLFREQGSLSKARARQLSGYSMDTIITLFRGLEDDGYITPCAEACADPEPRGKGRPAELYRLVARRELYLGVTFNQAGLWIVLVGLDGQVAYSAHAELPPLSSQAAFIDFFRAALGAFLAEHVAERAAMVRAAVALPGQIDAERGVLVRYTLLPALAGLDLVPVVRELAGDLPVFVQHNITGLASDLLRQPAVAGLGRRILYVSARSGTAHALIQDGRLLIDNGEMGHMSVSGLERACQCGRTGCLDTIFSAPAFHALFPGVAWPELGALVARGDEAGRAAWAKLEPAFAALVEVLINLSASFSPNALVLSGELFACRPGIDAWLAGQMRARYGAGGLPDWVPSAVRFLPTGAGQAAVGLCLSLIDQQWSWQAE